MLDDEAAEVGVGAALLDVELEAWLVAMLVLDRFCWMGPLAWVDGPPKIDEAGSGWFGVDG